MPYSVRIAARHRRLVLCRLLVTLCALLPSRISAIAFDEVARDAGIVASGPTYGAAWGDVNGDGMPDLFVSNHGTPTLFENVGGGRFSIATSRIQNLQGRDAHGQAWADFDNDGDQDLINVVGGANPNFFYVNEGGQLVDRALQFEVGLPGARSRMPLWVDFDLDGRLDLILTQEAGGAFPPVAMRNVGSRFENVSAAMGFPLTTAALAELANLTGSTAPEILVDRQALIHFPGYVYETASSNVFVDVTTQLGLPAREQSASIDGVIADFTGDLRNDIFIVKRSNNMQLVQTSSSELRARMNANANERAFTFDAAGVVTISLFPDFTATPAIVRVGASGAAPASFTLTLDPADPAVAGVASHVAGTDFGIFVGLLPTGSWSVAHSSPTSRNLDVRVRSVGPISAATPIGFAMEPPGARPNFYVATGTNFVEQRTSAGLDAPMDCNSGVAGDFDNDMDVDLYVVCADPVVNTPNLLFENLGAGTFVQVAGGGGASGTTIGKGESVVSADYDLDGFLDLFVTNGWQGVPFNNGPRELFRNRGNSNHWLEIDLVGNRSNRDAVGARVTLSAGGVTQLREQNGGMHRVSQNHQRLHFGLGSHATIDRVDVVWPSGVQTTAAGIQADRVVTLREPSPAPPACGLGGELIPALLALLGWRQRRSLARQPRASSARKGSIQRRSVS